MKDPNKATVALRTLQTAMGHYEAGQLLSAEGLCRQVLAHDPRNADSLHMLGAIAAQSGRYSEAVELFSKAIQVKKDIPLFHFNLGLTLQKLGKPDEALPKYKKAVSLKPDYIEAHDHIGGILKEQGRLEEAELKYKRIITFKPDYADAYYNLGLLLQEQGKAEEAIGEYKQFIALKPDSPTAHNNLGILFNGLGKHDEAAAQYERAVSLKPDYAEAHYNFGNTLRDQGKLDAAVAQYVEAISLKPHLVEARINLGATLKKLGLLIEAVVQYEQALILKADSPSVLAELVHLIHHACAWAKIGDYETRLLDMVRQGREGISPFIILGTSATAQDQLICARTFSRHWELPPQKMFSHAARKPSERIRIGYLSSDFYEHATANLMAELFELHNRSRFEITAYSYGPDAKSDIRRRLVEAFEHFVDLRNLSDADVAQKINDDSVDILVDLKGGYTGDARIGIAAYRPAPVQVNFVGYPGTMGVSFIDYIVADPFLIPPDQQKFYSEQVTYLTDCYQPNDTHKKISETTPSRAACGLPEKGFAFCCFNVCYKITPEIFGVWMRLLQAVSGSVLWLLDSNLSVKDNLKQAAVRHGVDPDRLVFAPRMSLPDHLARHRLADLFLDTLPINAHTTASDALWAGLPVLTCAGTTFAGRVAGSLLTAAELPQLVTNTLQDYEALALKLARDPTQLAEIREKLARTKLQTPLFDIGRFRRNIEKAYEKMWQIWQMGNGPKSFAVK